MSPETKLGLVIFVLVLLLYALCAGALRLLDNRRRRRQLEQVQDRWNNWVWFSPDHQDSRIALTLRTATSLADARQFVLARETLEWLWTTDGLPVMARVCAVQAMAIIYRAEEREAAATNCERWAETLTRLGKSK